MVGGKCATDRRRFEIKMLLKELVNLSQQTPCRWQLKLVLRAGRMGVNVPNMDQRCLSWDLDQTISNQDLGTLDSKLFGIQPYDHGAKSLASLKSEQENPDLYYTFGFHTWDFPGCHCRFQTQKSIAERWVGNRKPIGKSGWNMNFW